MVYSFRKNAGTQRPVYRNNDAAGSHRIVNISGLWKAQERYVANEERIYRKTDQGGWRDLSGRLTSKHEAARQAGFSGQERL